MNVKNCPSCGRMFVPTSSSKVCDPCKHSDEAGFNSIKEFIEEYPNSTMGEVSNATGVSIKKILNYVREGRLVATETMMTEIGCKSCGQPVKTGNFCEDCALKMNKDIQGLYREDEKPEVKMTGIKMNTQNRL
ncbi:MAG: hypothetical protein FWD98_03095 [Defluviitaleaceae bacterium]|nr:hypothetical protein [Defluviitaleaceae bacterium]